MTRRMQANHRSHRTLHGVEHDEIDACRLGFPCEPKLTPAEPGVLVGATGTYLVIDGKVAEASILGEPNRRAATHGLVYRVEVQPPFFEVGKTYRQRNLGDIFEVVRVDTDGDGDPVAYGTVTFRDGRPKGPVWRTRTLFANWEEVTA